MNLLGRATDKAFWAEVRESDAYSFFRSETHRMWNEHCEGRELSALRYSDFKRFFVDGNRSIYEAEYFTRRIGMDSAAILALMYPEEEKYINRLMDTIYAICDEYTWCLPAHQGQCEYNDNCRVDLFASETAFALAEIYTILNDRLDPLIKSRILVEIERRVLAPYEQRVHESVYWEKYSNNWNSVCTTSVACTYMLLHPDRARASIPRFEEAMQIYLSAFKDDGICDEGCGYWRYGFGFFIVYADMIKTFTDGAIDHFASEKVEKIAQFEQNMFLSGNSSVSFADAAVTMRSQLAINHYLKSIYPDEITPADINNVYVNDHCGRFCLYLRSATWFNEAYLTADALEIGSEFYGESTEWLVKKMPTYAFAAKGGHNKENHNHNDVGSFIVARGGRQILTDPGAGTYTAQYFRNEHRYEVFEASSRGHCVPIIGGEYQKFGEEYTARDVKYEDGIFSMDIAGAYGLDDLHSLSRTFDIKDEGLTLTDEFDYVGDGIITERFISQVAPEVRDDGSIVLDGITLTATPCAAIRTGEQIIKYDKVVYVIDLDLPRGTDKFVCVIK